MKYILFIENLTNYIQKKMKFKHYKYYIFKLT